jgi:hypothetical protein
MADTDLNTVWGFVDKRRGRGTTTTEANAETANMTSIAAMRTRLAALNGAYYTTARLNTMTENDMIYALKDSAQLT